MASELLHYSKEVNKWNGAAAQLVAEYINEITAVLMAKNAAPALFNQALRYNLPRNVADAAMQRYDYYYDPLPATSVVAALPQALAPYLGVTPVSSPPPSGSAIHELGRAPRCLPMPGR